MHAAELALSLWVCSAAKLSSTEEAREREPGICNRNHGSLKHPGVPTSKFSSVTSDPDWLTEQQNFNSNKRECASR